MYPVTKMALTWSLVWISLSMLFSLLILKFIGIDKFAQFQAAYWIEKALSIDNLFVFILVFNFFKVPPAVHRKVLFWGILGALFFRAVFIFSGVRLINLTYLPAFELLGKSIKINVILTIFGLFLVQAGIKSWFVQDEKEEEQDFNKSAGSKLIHRLFKVSKNYAGDRFFTRENGIKMATPLLIVLAVIEFSDLIFAIDSIPAIFAIAPDDPLILYMSNIFAILGLRALYFLLANFIHIFHKLSYGLAIILTFIGLKMLISPWLHISSPISLGFVGLVLLISMLASILSAEKDTHQN